MGKMLWKLLRLWETAKKLFDNKNMGSYIKTVLKFYSYYIINCSRSGNYQCRSQTTCGNSTNIALSPQPNTTSGNGSISDTLLPHGQACRQCKSASTEGKKSQ